MKKICLLLCILLLTSQTTNAGNYRNDLRTLFLNNQANICGINIRNFNSKDTNKNEIIDENEISGNFLNAIERLDEIKDSGFNTIHLLPITPVGKLKALGTAGSLYSISNFKQINPQLADASSNLTPKEQAKKFIDECHNRGIRVIIDLPSCGSYDLFLSNPELFLKDDKMLSIIPSDWTDVRLLNPGTDEKLNQDVMNAHKEFVDFIQEIGADGIRADVATIKPHNFWVELTKYAREKDSEFMFLAEASDSWRESPSTYAEFTPYNKLLDAGFDGYYGSFFNLKDWNASEFIEHIKFNKKLLTTYDKPKSVILSFTTHDEVSPVILHGENFSIMISWLYATLPFNPYCIDGFQTGDKYIYPWENTKAKSTETDDDTYFVHRGKLDIFNFSRKPGGKSQVIAENFKLAQKYRENNIELITKGIFTPLKTNNEKVFAYRVTLDNKNTVVIGNLDFQNDISCVHTKLPKLRRHTKPTMIKGKNIKISRNCFSTDLTSGEIKIFEVNLK